MFEEIYLEPDEEVTSAIEKLKKSRQDAVALVLPRQSVLGQSIVNLKLIYKQAHSLGKQIALISPDKVTRGLAERIGFPVFESLNLVNFGDSAAPKTAKKSEKAAEPEAAPQKPTKKEAEESAAKSEKKDESSPAESNKDLASAGFKSQAVTAKADDTLAEAVGLDDPSDDAPVSEEEKEDEETEPAKEDAPAVSTYARPASDRAAAGAPSMIPSRGNLRFYRQTKRRKWWIPLVIVLVILLGGGTAFAMVVPKATIKITVQAQPFEDTIRSTVDTEATAVDVDKAVLPGKTVVAEVESKISAKATGKKDIGTKATGTITLANEWDSLPHTFAAGTQVRSKSGLIFNLTTDVTVPGASSNVVAGKSVISAGKKEADVQAAEAGSNYNVEATSFTLPSLPKAQQEKIYATSAEAFTGGTSQVVTVATASDISKLTDNVKTLNRDQGLAKVKEQAAGALIVEKAIQTVTQDVTTSVAADAQADSVEATAKGKFQVISFSADDHKQLLEKALANKIPQGQRLVTSGDGVSIDTSQFDLNLASEKKLELTNNLKAFTVTDFDPNLVKRSLIGSAPQSAGNIVSQKLATEKVEASIQPSWWPRLPFLGKNIELEFTYTPKQK